jgi:hypothetical protein
MSKITKQPRAGRPANGNAAKKVVSLTLDPAIIAQVDAYATEHKISRSAAIETILQESFEAKPQSMIAPAVNSLVQPENIYATPAIGEAILY